LKCCCGKGTVWTECTSHVFSTRILHIPQSKHFHPLSHNILTPQVLSNTAGTTIGTSPYSDSLKRRRKGAASALNRPSIQTYIPHLDVETKTFVEELLTYGKSGREAVDPMPMIQRLSLSLALTLNWGIRMDSQNDPLFEEITHVEEEVSRFRSTTGNLQDYIPLLRYNPFAGSSAKAKSMRNRRDVYLNALNRGLDERIAAGTDKPCIQGNVIKDKDAQLNNEELTSISLTMLSGGLDTITTLLQWSILLLSQRPDIQAAAHSAIAEFYSPEDPLCDAQDDQKCKYIIALVRECLRYYTVLRLALPRVSIKDVTYNGIRIPAGTVFFLNAWACNMDSAVWSDPETFRPERWFEQPDAPMFTYGLGYRMCAGSLLANRELYLAFIRLLNAFEIKAGPRDVNAHPISGLSDPTSLVALPQRYEVFFVPRREKALAKALEEFEVTGIVHVD
jgi:3-hydroxyphenylacetate 6-hydroxylase